MPGYAVALVECDEHGRMHVPLSSLGSMWPERDVKFASCIFCGEDAYLVRIETPEP